ncbi:MAG: hypothetical protein E6J14_05685 [Chloroflexi bacterium]|nr:MAG: hypothetical protein E6J14_05685 [Chloroflexota bacterium]
MALLELRVKGLAVLAGVRCEPGPGLTALTGETGAGKSMCVAALRLVLGGRVDLDPSATAGATVAAVFDAVPAPLRERLESLGVEDGGELLTLSRELPGRGRGACRINGALVSQATLREAGEALVEVTAQGESHRLLRPSYQRALLDGFGGAQLLAARSASAQAVQRWWQAQQRLASARDTAARQSEAVRGAADTVADLGGLGLRAGEDDELLSERRRLVHAVRLARAAGAVRTACSGDGDSGGAADLLAAAAAEHGELGGVDHALAELLGECGRVAEEVRELASRARTYGDGLVVDDTRLAAVDERLEVIDRASRRHGGTLAGALEALAAAESLLAGAGQADEAGLACEVEAREAEVVAAVTTLSQLRTSAARRLEAAVVAQLRRLRLRHARFRVVVEARPDEGGLTIGDRRVAAGSEGVDEIDFRLATTPDGVPIPLGQGPSGGELSRLALALRAVVALGDDCATLVLDEVDAGLGGETAARVGEALVGIGVGRQVMVVTHRAEIASRAATHLVVERGDLNGRARASVRAVDGEERVAEVARLMSGRQTAAALARARELLEEGGLRSPRRAAATIGPG